MSLTIVSIFKRKIKVVDQFIYYINQSHLLSYIYLKFFILKLIIIPLVLQSKWLINLKPYITFIDEYWNACDNIIMLHIMCWGNCILHSNYDNWKIKKYFSLILEREREREQFSLIYHPKQIYDRIITFQNCIVRSPSCTRRGFFLVL